MDDLLRVVAFSSTQADSIFEGEEEEEEEEGDEEEGDDESSEESEEDEESSEEQEQAEASKAAVEQSSRPAADAMDEVRACTLSCQASGSLHLQCSAPAFGWTPSSPVLQILA